MTTTEPHQALYRVWRAQTFAGIVGQEATVTALRNATRTGRLAHALLFVGPRGTGKTSLARIVAKALNCTDLRDGEPCDRCAACVAIREGTSLDVAEMDAASNNRVDDMRELLPRIATAPSDLRKKVFIIDEVQRIKEGWDVLLKTLEEPPEHVAFIFCTTDAGGIRPAVLSRVQRFDFRKLTVEQIAGKLTRILADTGREADDDAIDLIARLAAGGMRDAESMLDQLLSGGGDRLTADGVRALLGLADADSVARFLTSLAEGDAATGMVILDELEDRGRDPRAFLDQVLDALRTALVAGLSGRPGSDLLEPGRLITIGRRLAAIDPARLGPGGLRFQLDLVLLDEVESPATTSRLTAPSISSTPTQRPAPSRPVPPPTASPSSSAGPTGQAREPAPEPARELAARASTPATSVVLPGSPDAGEAAAPTPRRAAPSRGDGTPEASSSAASIPAASTAPSEPRAGASSPDLAALLAVWAAVVTDLSQLPAVKPLIAACRPISVDERIVTLGFPEHQAFLKDLLERRRSTVEEGITRQTGAPVSVRFVATNLELVSPAPAEDDGERLIAEARRIFADDLVDVGEVS